MLKLVYPACFYPCEGKDGYTVVIPDLPGCITEGGDLPNAIEMAVDAASGWVLDALENKEELPKPTLDMSKIELEYSDGFVSMIALDMDTYAEKYGNKAVRKNCTIPAWLNTRAEAMHINFSQILQNALLEQLNIGK